MEDKFLTKFKSKSILNLDFLLDQRSGLLFIRVYSLSLLFEFNPKDANIEN